MGQSVTSHPRRRLASILAGIAILAVALSACLPPPPPQGGGTAANPTVSGPITGGNGAILPANLNGFDLGQVGYQQSEYLLSGTASAYSPSSPLTADGKWTVTPRATAPYTTRAVVYRPNDPARFNER